MVIELDHVSTDAATAIMDIVEARGYSGVVSSHSWMHSAKGGGLHNNTRRLINAGGVVAPYNSDADGMVGRVTRYLDAVEQTSYWPGVGLGSDRATPSRFRSNTRLPETCRSNTRPNSEVNG